MARDFLQIVKRIEGMYPQSKGTTTINAVAQNKDEQLRSNLVGYANDIYREIEQSNRWLHNFMLNTIITTPGVAGIALPGNLTNVVPYGGGMTHLHRIYYRLASGRIVDLELMEQNEPRWVYGDGPNAVLGSPRFYSLMGGGTMGGQNPISGAPAAPINVNAQLFPAPDGNGPDGGNYTLQVEYYSELTPMVEAAITTVVGSLQTFPTPQTGVYLANAGVPASSTATNQLASIRGSGSPTSMPGINATDDTVGTWSLLTGNTVTISAGCVQTLVPIYFNSINWVIGLRPNLLLYGMCRQVATYLKDEQAYASWEQRFQKELEDTMEWDQQSRHDVEVLAAAVGGQQQRQLMDADWPNLFDSRGFNS